MQFKLAVVQVKPTAAVYRVRDPLEVMSFLTSLVEWGRSADNAWHQTKGCSGWRLNADSASLSSSLRRLQSDTASCSSQASGKIGDKSDRTHSPFSAPSPSWLNITSAFIILAIWLAQSSSCLRIQSGAVIADISLSSERAFYFAGDLEQGYPAWKSGSSMGRPPLAPPDRPRSANPPPVDRHTAQNLREKLQILSSAPPAQPLTTEQ